MKEEPHNHKFYCCTSHYNYKIHEMPIIFKCVDCGQEATNKFREMIQKIKWFVGIY